MSANSKLVLIGLDGATFRVLRPLVEAGVMPTLAGFLRDGASGTLLSTHPPVTCPAWPTMFTGVNPGKHGVFSFTCRHGVRGRPHTASSLDVRAPTVWELLGRAGPRWDGAGRRITARLWDPCIGGSRPRDCDP
ncbi:MAG: alkaline phosphatase family protein [Deltaproteobacteria bacterium]|nr:alkaline phosphatase family protein [Deltaproteobacteria bacterium]